MIIRMATIQDVEAIAAVEAACFPKAEAASKESIRERILVYSNHFWVMEVQNIIVAFVNGMVTEEAILRDEMFDNVELHNEDGQWQMIFSVSTAPEHRRKGYARKLLERAIEDAKKQERKGVVLTCKERLVGYYETFGFVKEGQSKSTHGGAVWYDMRLTF